MKDILKPIIVLALICLLVTASLAYVNIKTAPVIKAAEEKANRYGFRIKNIEIEKI